MGYLINNIIITDPVKQYVGKYICLKCSKGCNALWYVKNLNIEYIWYHHYVYSVTTTCKMDIIIKIRNTRQTDRHTHAWCDVFTSLKDCVELWKTFL